MKNPFKKEAANYKGEIPVTPYQLAQQEWDQRIGSSRVQARNWRMLAMMLLAIVVLLLVVLIAILTIRKDRVYIAEVSTGGRVVNIAPLTINYQPDLAQKEYFLSNFVALIRNLPLDPVVAKQNWLTAYQFLNGRAAERLNAYFKQDNPIAALGKKTVTTQIIDVNPVSPSTIHMQWVETTTNINGQEEGKKNYSGVFTFVIKQPRTQEEILHNPLGIYIVDFDISPKEG
jgi:type IV secretion system protein TrbF